MCVLSGPPHSQVSPDFQRQIVKLADVIAARVGLRPVRRVGDEVVDDLGWLAERGLRTRGPMPNALPPGCAGFRLTLQITSKCQADVAGSADDVSVDAG